MATLFCGAYIAHLFSLLRKRAHYHSLGGPPGPLSPSGFAPIRLQLIMSLNEKSFLLLSYIFVKPTYIYLREQ